MHPRFGAYVSHNYYTDRYDLIVYRRALSIEGGELQKHVAKITIEWIPVREAEMLPQGVAPSLGEYELEVLQKIYDALFEAGALKREKVESNKEMQATTKHLEDMRSLVFSYLKSRVVINE